MTFHFTVLTSFPVIIISVSHKNINEMALRNSNILTNFSLNSPSLFWFLKSGSKYFVSRQQLCNLRTRIETLNSCIVSYDVMLINNILREAFTHDNILCIFSTIHCFILCTMYCADVKPPLRPFSTRRNIPLRRNRAERKFNLHYKKRSRESAANGIELLVVNDGYSKFIASQKEIAVGVYIW